MSIITGGPGTGKTTVQRVLLYISEKLGEEKILLTAPTGRASRRMAESTGKSDALTLHSALGLNNDEECEAADEMLSEDFIIADEFTMADMRLSYELFKHIEKGVRVVIVGDVDQLPSVGPGNVFRELVLCGVIPVTILDMVFRQGKDSRIAANAHKMQENDTNLDYGDDFIFCPADTAAEAADKVAEYYRSFVDAYGVDNVQVLTPFRKKGEASVNALNDRLWEMVNPKSSIARELKAGNALYREGDRIIHNKIRMTSVTVTSGISQISIRMRMAWILCGCPFRMEESWNTVRRMQILSSTHMQQRYIRAREVNTRW